MTLRAHRGYGMERCDKCGRNGQLPEWRKESTVSTYSYPQGYQQLTTQMLAEHLHFACPCGYTWDVRPLDAPRPKLVQRDSCI